MNACEDFIEIVGAGFIIGAALEVLSLNSVDETHPDSSIQGAEDIWTRPDDKRQALLLSISKRI